jgi:hypothetical protein
MTEPSQPPTPAKTTARRTPSRALLVALGLVIVVVAAGIIVLRSTQTRPFSSHTKIAALDYISADVAQAEIRN